MYKYVCEHMCRWLFGRSSVVWKLHVWLQDTLSNFFALCTHQKLLFFLFFFSSAFQVISGKIDKNGIEKSPVYFVILAGGSGERLWPLSKSTLPKQLLHVEHNSFLQQAIMRIEPLAPSVENIVIVTSALHEPAISKSVGHLVGAVLTESEARNTGPAILYTCLQISAIDPSAIAVFLPADAFINSYDNGTFASYLQRAIDFVESHRSIAILGIEPTYPALGYGYIEFDSNVYDEKTGLHKVRKFHEKPHLSIAQHYLKQSNMLWNIGIMCGSVGVLLEHFQKHAPQLYDEMHAFELGTKNYHDISSIAVEPAIIEPSDQIWVLPTRFSWCDVGNMNIFLTLKKQFSSLGGDCIEVNASNNLVDVPNKLVALIGVNDLCVVETDDELLIVHQSETEKIKLIVQQLKEKGVVQHL